MDANHRSVEPALPKIAIAGGFVLLIVASATILAVPVVATAGSLGAVIVGVLLRKYCSDGAQHATVLSHVVLLSGGIALFALSIAATAPAAKFFRVYLPPLMESLFFNFGTFIVGYLLICCMLFTFILMAQNYESP